MRDILSKNLIQIRFLTSPFPHNSADYSHYRRWRLAGLCSDISELQIWGSKCSDCPNLDYKKALSVSNQLKAVDKHHSVPPHCALCIETNDREEFHITSKLSPTAGTFSDMWTQRRGRNEKSLHLYWNMITENTQCSASNLFFFFWPSFASFTGASLWTVWLLSFFF